MPETTDLEKQTVAELAARLPAAAKLEGIDLKEIDVNMPLVNLTYLRFARARKLDVEHALQLLIMAIKWRLKFKPQLVGEIWAGYALSKLESVQHGLDNEGNALVWFFPDKHKDYSGKLEIYARGVVYIAEQFIRDVLYPTGKRLSLVWDIKNLGLSNLDYGFLKFAIDAFATAYPESLARILIVDAPWLFSPIWKIVKPWVDPATASKVIFVTRQELGTHLNLSTVPKAWGGAEDWTPSYTPRTPGLVIPSSLDDYQMPPPEERFTT